MRFLLVNDDGIFAVGILAVKDAAVKRGHQVVICAPAGQQSGKGQSIMMDDPIYVERRQIDGVESAFAVFSTPADCIRLGLDQLVNGHFDAVISGINDGYNSGTATYYSGTIGAAREAALSGRLSVASSVAYRSSPEALYDAAEETVSITEQLVGKSLPCGLVVSLNFPGVSKAQWGKTQVCPLDIARFEDCYEKHQSPRRGEYYWLGDGGHRQAPAEGTDCYFLQKGCPTCTFMTFAPGECNKFAGILDFQTRFA